MPVPPPAPDSASDADQTASYDHRVRLSFPYADERRARVVHGAIRVETGEIDDDRSRAGTAREGATVAVTVRARDLTALRAGVNTWVRLVDTAEAVAAAADGDRAGSGTAE